MEGKKNITEVLDTIPFLNSLVFLSHNSWKEDSIQRDLAYRRDEFTGNQMWKRRLKYVINDSLRNTVNPDDDDKFGRGIEERPNPSITVSICTDSLLISYTHMVRDLLAGHIFPLCNSHGPIQQKAGYYF